MATTDAIVQNNKNHHHHNSHHHTVGPPLPAPHHHHHHQLSSISLMLEYDIDNTLNTIKENSQALIANKMIPSHFVNGSSNNDPDKKETEGPKEITPMMDINSLDSFKEKTSIESNSLKGGCNNSNINKNGMVNNSRSSDNNDANIFNNKLENFDKAAAFQENNNEERTTPKSVANSENSNARKRWRILAKVLRKDSDENPPSSPSSSSPSSCSSYSRSNSSSNDENLDPDEMASVRRFKTFNILKQDNLININSSINENNNCCNNSTAKEDIDMNGKIEDDEKTAFTIAKAETNGKLPIKKNGKFDNRRNSSNSSSVEILNFLGKPENWYTYKIALNDFIYSVNIHHLDRHITAKDLMGFNNTGNICVWPSEEALTVYALSNLNEFRNKWILELGGGMTCLAGLMLAKYAKPFAVHLTDGNSVSIENVRKTICLNELSCYTKCSILEWEQKTVRLPMESEKFDIILTADCLFFDEARSALIDTIWYYLSKSGYALVMAPKRGRTMSLFVDECLKRNFSYELIYRYNEEIWRKHVELKENSNLYDEDIHYPILIKLTKSS